MYIEWYVTETMDFADIISSELFEHATREESADCILEIIRRFFDFYDKAKSD